MQEDRNYCVYLHRNKRTNEVFYVGSGRPKRATETTQRNSAWKEIVKDSGFVAEILKSNLSKKESIIEELSVYNQYNNLYKLVNKFPPRILNDYPILILQDHLYYDEKSPTCLRRRIDTICNNGGKGSRAGDKAGSTSNGTRLVKVLGKMYLIHKVVWILHFGKIPDGYVVDHIDGNPSNNRITNLRVLTQAENCRNQKLAKNNKSGVSGVILHKHGKGKSDAWKAQYVDLNGKVITKSFTISIYGNDEAFRLACEYRRNALETLNSQGAGYTNRHGT